VLDEAAEEAMCKYIDFADEVGIPLREKSLIIAANAILRNWHSGDGSPCTVSKMWPAHWLDRHSEYQKRSRKPLAVTRKNTHDPEGISRWFDKLLAVKEEYGILDDDIHNMDETGFRIGVGRKHKVITRAGNNIQYMTDPGICDYITSIESIYATGEVQPPMVFLKAASIIERWVVDELAGDTMLASSDSGYSNAEINFEWLKHWEKVTQLKTKGIFRLLLLDGATFHIEYDFVDYADKHNIVLCGLPPHSTHFLQPLDVVCFQP
jgi:DDE superfamily endonuclease/Tc5 transposase DNA-binding domain